ncbi:MAG: cell envelope integrity protein CreD [Bacteroidales bacterium]
MKNSESTINERINKSIRTSITVRIITIIILILLLLIPVTMVQDLIRERKQRQDEAFREISSSWADEQKITGPVITIPYKQYEKVKNANTQAYNLIETIEYAHFFPKTLSITSDISPKERYRGIYTVIVYNSQLDISGTFSYPNFSTLDIDEKNVLWDKAYISIGITDVRGIQEQIFMNWEHDTLVFNPGIENTDLYSTGISSPLSLAQSNDKKQHYTFAFNMNCNGSSQLSFLPLGKTTEVSLKAKWGTPKFEGAFLPDSRTITNDSVYANWQILHLNRPYPQQLSGTYETHAIQQSEFGITLKIPIDHYQKSMRSAKYAALFITLTFVMFFLIQILQKVRIHPIQYIIVGLALCIFYTLLIAISEHMAFGWSYLIASSAIVGLIGMYSYFMFNNTRITSLFLLLLSILYGFIFIIIQLEDYALLMGSIGLFTVLGVVMYLSRKIDWYKTEAL